MCSTSPSQHPLLQELVCSMICGQKLAVYNHSFSKLHLKCSCNKFMKQDISESRLNEPVIPVSL